METKKEVQENIDKFLLEEILMLSINGAFQTRGESIYEDCNDKKRENIRNDIKNFLTNEIYKIDSKRYSKDEVKILIDKLKELAEKNHKEILKNEKFRIGISQKIINLFLKYLWVIGKKEMPPLCPIDGIIKLKILETQKIELE